MLKRFLLLAGLLSFGSPAFAAGTIPFSLSQQFDSLGHVLAGCQLYTIQAGTTSTPQSAYQDSALTIALPNPQTCDAAGRLPQMFLADGTIKVRLTDRNGVTQVVADNIQVIGASSGGGGGGTVDPTTILATGDVKVAYGTGTLSGFVRANGRTIGSATSGASERSNADCQALFVQLWNVDGSLAVSGGRGASGAADWAANKTIALPDWRGRTLAGLDDMGNSAAGRLTSSYFGATATILGAVGGSESHTLTTSEMPVHSHGVTDPGHTHTITNATVGVSPNIAYSMLIVGSNATGGAFGQTTVSATTGISINNAGSGGAHATVQPTMLATIYVKL
jgi:microcystin-dependent protein